MSQLYDKIVTLAYGKILTRKLEDIKLCTSKLSRCTGWVQALLLRVDSVFISHAAYCSSTCLGKSQFIAKYNNKDFVLLSPQWVAINGAIICRVIRDRVSLARESGILPLSHCASMSSFMRRHGTM